jgi:pimeloyl-ACP methyl ester carboxylesterase
MIEPKVLYKPLPHRRAGQGSCVVLVHGYLGGSQQWDSVIAPDLPGFGDAADLPGCATIGAMAERVIALLDHLGVGRFVLLGHSMGGMIVQDMAAKLGNRVEKLVLYCTGPLGLMPDRFEPITQSRDRLAQDGVARTTRRIGATWFRNGADAPGFPLVAQIGARANRQAALSALDAMAAWDGRDKLHSLAMPTLVVWGHDDQSYRWSQIEALWQTVPNTTLAVLPGASHAAHLEKPRLFLATLDDFLAE